MDMVELEDVCSSSFRKETLDKMKMEIDLNLLTLSAGELTLESQSGTTDKPGESLSTFFRWCLQFVKRIQVWPPSTEKMMEELTVVSNYLLTYLAAKDASIKTRLPNVISVRQTICQSLGRAHECISKRKFPHPRTYGHKNYHLSETIQLLVEDTKDPASYLRSKPLLSRVVAVAGLGCLFLLKTGDTYYDFPGLPQYFHYMKEFIERIGEDVLKEPMPLKNGRFCSSGERNSVPSVHDFATLVGSPKGLFNSEKPILFREWDWLNPIIDYRQNMRLQCVFSSVNRFRFEKHDNLRLDPEIRFTLLCIMGNRFMSLNQYLMAARAYKNAMTLCPDNPLIHHYSAELYKEMDMPDLELNSLEKLVELLLERVREHDKTKVDFHLDILVFNLLNIHPKLELPTILYNYAKRCKELDRYNCASEQYMRLLELLQEYPDDNINLPPIKQAGRTIGIPEIVVEAGETMVIGGQTQEFLALFEEFSPILCAEVGLFQQSVTPGDFRIQTDSVELDCDDVSHGSLFHPSRQTLEDLVRRKRSSSLSKFADESTEQEDKADGAKSNIDLGELLTMDPWWEVHLAVRLLVSKVDLTSREGYTQEMTSLLNRSLDMLQSGPYPIHVLTPPPQCQYKPEERAHLIEEAESNPSPYVRERMRLWLAESPDNKAVPYKLSDSWRSSMILVMDRMLKVALNQNDKLSARNCASLLLQLDPDNTFAQEILNHRMYAAPDNNVSSNQRTGSDI